MYELKGDSDESHAPNYAGRSFPVVALRASDRHATDLTAFSHRLREGGWILPAYTLPPVAQAVGALRMVVKESLSRAMVDMLAHDLHAALKASRRQQPTSAQRPQRHPNC